MDQIASQSLGQIPPTFSIEEFEILKSLNPNQFNVASFANGDQHPARDTSTWDDNYLPRTGSGVYLANSGAGQKGGFIPLAPLAPIAIGALAGLSQPAFRWLGSKIFGKGQYGGLSLDEGLFRSALDNVRQHPELLTKFIGPMKSRNFWGGLRDYSRDMLINSMTGPNTQLKTRIADAAMSSLIPGKWTKDAALRTMSGRGNKPLRKISDSAAVVWSPLKDAINRVVKLTGAGKQDRAKMIDIARQHVERLPALNIFDEDAESAMEGGAPKWVSKLKTIVKAILPHVIEPVMRLATMGKDKLIDYAVQRFELSDQFGEAAKNITNYPLNWIKNKGLEWASQPDIDPEASPAGIEIGQQKTPEQVGVRVEEAITKSAAPKEYLPAVVEGAVPPENPLAGTVISAAPQPAAKPTPVGVARAYSGAGRGKRGGAKKKTKQPTYQIKWL